MLLTCMHSLCEIPTGSEVCAQPRFPEGEGEEDG